MTPRTKRWPGHATSEGGSHLSSRSAGFASIRGRAIMPMLVSRAMIGGLDRDRILREVTLGPRAALVPLDDSRIIERPGWWQVITPSLTRGGLNEVMCSELPEHEADAIIDETIASYRALGIERFRWTIGPRPQGLSQDRLARSGPSRPRARRALPSATEASEHSCWTQPSDLGERLMRRGLVRAESLAMARATEGVSRVDAFGITVELVTDADTASFTSVMAEGWQADPVQLDVLHRRMLAAPAGRNHLFLARLHGEPAAAAGSADLDRAVYLMGAVVLSRFRGRGLYRALVQARLAHGAARGFAVGVSIARADTSAPVLARLGFETIAPIVTFASE